MSEQSERHIRFTDVTKQQRTIFSPLSGRTISCNIVTSGVPRNFVRGGGVQKIQLRTENGYLGAVATYPRVKGSGGSCKLVQEISFHIVKVS